MKNKLIIFILSLFSFSMIAGEIVTYESDAYGFNTKSYFYIGDDGVIAIDSQFSAGKTTVYVDGVASPYKGHASESIKLLKSKTSLPIKDLIITHPNPDKYHGISEFKKLGTKVWMSNSTQKNLPLVDKYKRAFFTVQTEDEIAKTKGMKFLAKDYPKLVDADNTFEQKEIINFGSEKIELYELNLPGMSTNHTVIFLPAKNVLFVGDLIHYKAHAWLEGNVSSGQATFSKANWIRALNKLADLFPTNPTVYAGRGESTKLFTAITEQTSYLHRAQRLVQDYVASRKGLTKKEKLSNVNYVELQKKFENKFGGYALSYMIYYGAYGIVNTVELFNNVLEYYPNNTNTSIVNQVSQDEVIHVNSGHITNNRYTKTITLELEVKDLAFEKEIYLYNHPQQITKKIDFVENLKELNQVSASSNGKALWIGNTNNGYNKFIIRATLPLNYGAFGEYQIFIKMNHQEFKNESIFLD